MCARWIKMVSMRRPFCRWTSLSSLVLIVLLESVSSGQTKERVEGHVFRSDALGITYAFPEQFSARTASQIPNSESSVERMLLALWSNPDRSGDPRISLLYDKKVRPAGRTRQQMAERYLQEVRQMWAGVPGVKISPLKETSPAGYPLWRVDFFQPDNSPHFESAAVIPLPDRRLLVIQMNAPSQAELDAELETLKNLHFDRTP